MIYSKIYDNGLKIVLKKIEGMFSVSLGVLVNTGSVNETEENNGISHFIEHNLFKGTKKRNSLEISERIDNIGAQINAFTSKEMTCYYTKSTCDHLEDCMEVLSDIFFNSVFDEKELQKEKGVIIEEINMSNDTPDDVCFDLLSKAYFGDEGYGRTILGPSQNIKKFDKEYILNYMDDYYTADNVCISIAGNIDIDKTVKLIEQYFVNNFSNKKSKPFFEQTNRRYDKLNKYKKIEQSHITLSLPSFDYNDDDNDVLSIINVVFGGGMSSRLFQTLREDLGVAYSVYASASAYRSSGVLEIYAGVSNDKREQAFNAIKKEIEKIQKGISNKEFLMGKQQMKSAFIFGQESTYSQMRIYGKNMLVLNKEFNFEEKIKNIDEITLEKTNQICQKIFNLNTFATASVGPFKKPLT